MKFLKKNRVAFLLIAMSILFVALGIWRNEAQTVFRKAVNVCMECIGLG